METRAHHILIGLFTLLGIGAALLFVLWLGKTGGDRLVLAGERPIVVEALRDRHDSWLPIYMGAGLM